MTEVDVTGAGRLAQTLRAAADKIRDLGAVNADVARYLADRSRPRTPRRTGALAASARSKGEADQALILYTARHARPIHYGVPARHIGARPWAATTVAASAPAVMPMYLANVNETLSHVKGA